MTCGKTAAAEFAIVQSSTLSLRGAGHRGPVVEHYAWDGRAFGALTRLAKAWHNKQIYEGSGTHDSEMLSLLEFVVTTRCALHIVNKSLEWAMHSEFANRDLLRDVFVSIESIRQSYDLILRCAGDWVECRLELCDDLSNEEIEAKQILWRALGVESELADLLSEVLHLRFAHGRLRVARSAAPAGDVAAAVRTALLAAWRISTFADSRWLTVGKSSQGLVTGLVSGLGDLLDWILTETKASKYHLGGWRR
eukprot:4678031-Pyramimonas_sp.AAC.1